MTRASRLRVTPELIGLLLVYAGTASLALWQASRHPTPTIFSDEIEMAQLGRSIASTGRALLRDGAPFTGIAPLGAYLTAPLWWISDVPTAYAAIKAANSLVMAMAVVPAYGLARLVAGPRWSLFAAAGTGLSPALAYAPILVKEPVAYPVSTLALFLIARWVAAPHWRRLVLAVVLCGVGYVAKPQLQVLFAVLALSTLGVVWRRDGFTAFRRTWSRADWVGGGVLALGALVVLNAYITTRSNEWYVATTFFQHRMWELGLWSFGALAIGLGIVPFVAGLAWLVPARRAPASPGAAALGIVTVSSIVFFGLFTAIKAAFLSTVFATLIEERNLIFLVPLLFACTAGLLARRDARVSAVVAAGCLALYLVHVTPYSLTQYPNYEAHGLSIIALANRLLRWPASTIEHALVTVTVLATIGLVLVARRRPPRAALGIAVALAGFTLVWTTTTQIYAANGESLFSKRLYATLPKPANWLDRTTGGERTLFLGTAIKDPNPVQLLEFWNRSIVKVWALDGSAPGPGATATPNLDRTDGKITDPGTSYVLVMPGVDIKGRRVTAPVGGLTLYPSKSGIRLRTSLTGVYDDGWSGADAGYTRFDIPPGQTGRVKVDVSRAAWCGKEVRSTVRIRIGPVAIVDHQPSIVNVTAETGGVIHSCQATAYMLPTPPGPWRVEVSIDPTFSPARIDPSLGDARELGAVLGFTYRPSGTP